MNWRDEELTPWEEQEREKRMREVLDWMREETRRNRIKYRNKQWHLILQTVDGAMRTVSWVGFLPPRPYWYTPLAVPIVAADFAGNQPVVEVVPTPVTTRTYEFQRCDFGSGQAFYREKL